ncbi:ferredoxin [Mycobacterium hodleri]|uniref:ferredoxin n=1 Tax=Mycolicibacterium hodleri TaxID=49897 RepID=UPI0021F31838|nr:ferredoxin [Mycolicibacterium hodleri]MCV7136187.1 ferredoxin [Mycolicibacterium hodleri]
MTPRPDNRLADVPMTPIRCRRCASRVLVRKSSWAQTSVQWDADASQGCAERRQADQFASRGRLEPFLTCAALGETISDAARLGELTVVDDARR